MDKYDVIKAIGEGAFGKAYLAKGKSDSKLCVIKEISFAKSLISQLFEVSPPDRPSINSILKRPFLEKLIGKYLTPEIKMAERTKLAVCGHYDYYYAQLDLLRKRAHGPNYHYVPQNDTRVEENYNQEERHSPPPGQWPAEYLQRKFEAQQYKLKVEKQLEDSKINPKTYLVKKSDLPVHQEAPEEEAPVQAAGGKVKREKCIYYLQTTNCNVIACLLPFLLSWDKSTVSQDGAGGQGGGSFGLAWLGGEAKARVPTPVGTLKPQRPEEDEGKVAVASDIEVDEEQPEPRSDDDDTNFEESEDELRNEIVESLEKLATSKEAEKTEVASGSSKDAENLEKRERISMHKYAELNEEDGLQTNPMMYLEADNEAGWTDEWATGDQKGKCTSFTSPSHKVYQTVKEITLLN
ncbi:hypothetical protein CB1_000435009 [Camelus ferus]|nr:hypothetical protein CB1_000435009 [Camelus ferus]